MFDFTSIRDILKQERSKIIIVEDGRPSYVLLPIDEYRVLAERMNSNDHTREGRTPVKADHVIDTDAERGEIISPSATVTVEGWQSSRNIKLEDLPF